LIFNKNYGNGQLCNYASKIVKVYWCTK